MKKILITFVEAGNGHIVTAEAIAEALENIGNKDIVVLRKNVFHENTQLNKYEQFLINQTKKASSSPLHSRVQLASMHLFGSQNTLKFVYSTIYKKYTDLYVNEIRKINPDVIIDTHYFTSYAAIRYRDKYNPNCKIVTFDPDNNVHGWWCKKVDTLVVNNDVAYEQAIKKGFKKEQLLKVFFITRQNVLATNKSKQFYREKYGLPKDKFTVKLADGIYAKAKMESFIKELTKSKLPLTIIAICGKNEKLLQKLNALKTTLPENITLVPFGFVKDIAELFKASDLFIGKAGPNAVLDSVFMRTPIVLNYTANQIEHATKKLFIDKLGCGVFIGNKVKARKFVEQCIKDHSILDPFIENEKKIDCSHSGASQVAEFVIKAIK